MMGPFGFSWCGHFLMQCNKDEECLFIRRKVYVVIINGRSGTKY